MDDNQNAGASASADDAFMSELLGGGGESQGSQQPAQERPADPAPQPAREAERVPLRELLDEREKRQDYERRVREYEAAEQKRKEQEAPPPVPEWWVDPKAATQHEVQSFVSPIEERVVRQNFLWSERFAVSEHGREAVDAAKQAANEYAVSNPEWGQRALELLKRSPDPVGELIAWHKQQATLREVGSDHAAYRKKLEDELLANPEFLARAQEAARSAAAGNPRFEPARAPDGKFQPQPQKPQRPALPSMRTAGAAAPTGRLTEQSGDELLDEVFNAR